MDLTRFQIDFAALDADRLHSRFPAGDLAEISARWGDTGAMITYLARSNELTRVETEETILDLIWTAAEGDAALRAA